MEAALKKLEEVHCDFDGSWLRHVGKENFEKHYSQNLDAEGFCDLPVDERYVPVQTDLSMDMALFARWLKNDSFAVAKLLQAWVARFKAQGGTGEAWDLVRRGIQRIYEADDAKSAAAHARGASTVKASWLARLLDTGVGIPDFQGDSVEEVLCDELYALGEEGAFDGSLGSFGQAPKEGDEAQSA